MLHRGDGVTAAVRGSTRGPMLHELGAGQGMLTVRESLKVLLTHGSNEAPLGRELAVPGADDPLPFGVIVLARILELFGVVPPGLAGAQGFGDREHARRGSVEEPSLLLGRTLRGLIRSVA